MDGEIILKLDGRFSPKFIMIKEGSLTIVETGTGDDDNDMDCSACDTSYLYNQSINDLSANWCGRMAYQKI